MEEIIPSNEYTVVDDTAYANPQVALDEANNFIDNLRATQAQDTAKISSDTQKLGTDVSTSQGGLGGATSYFTSRYQTPQTESAIADLRATAQSKALSDVLENEQAYWKNQYSNAYKRASSSSSNSNSNSSSDYESIGDINESDPTPENAVGTAASVGTINLPSGSGNITMVQIDDEIQYINDDTGEVVVTDLNGNIKRQNTQSSIEQQKKVANVGNKTWL